MKCRVCPDRAASNGMQFCEACWLVFLVVMLESQRESVN